jgi:hypothetical protein
LRSIDGETKPIEPLNHDIDQFRHLRPP